ncbi:hypothetical protein VCHC17A1_3917, partial [Vibrio cholerae HC-17A1]
LGSMRYRGCRGNGWYIQKIAVSR